MSTKSKLENDLKEAMRARDDVKKRTLRMAISAIKLAEIDKQQTLDESALLAILQKEIKTRQETISEAQRGRREELVAEAEAEIEVLKVYLPKPLTRQELEELVRKVIEEVGATSMADMGQVMKTLTPRLEGRATGGEASQVVRQMLQQG